MVLLLGYKPIYYFYSQEISLLNSPGLLYFDNKNIARGPCLGWHGAIEVVISLSVFQGRSGMYRGWTSKWLPGCPDTLRIDEYNILDRDITSPWDITSPLHQKHSTSVTYTSNIICDTEERTFWIDSMCREKKYMGGSSVDAVVKIAKSTKRS